MEAKGHNEIVKAKIPLSEMLKYGTELKSLTAGRGSYHMEFSHYEMLPPHMTEQVVARAKQAEEAEDE